MENPWWLQVELDVSHTTLKLAVRRTLLTFLTLTLVSVGLRICWSLVGSTGMN
jgi:hypothetical protein